MDETATGIGDDPEKAGRPPPEGGDLSGDHPHVIASPPLIFLGFLVLGLGLEWLWPTALGLVIGFRVALAAGILAIAGGLAVTGIRAFRRAGTNVPPHKPATAIVTDGPFRYSRNPLYLGLALILAAAGVGLDSLWVLLMLAPMLVVIRYGVIAREERYLEAKFGDAYRRYKARVRRWL